MRKGIVLFLFLTTAAIGQVQSDVMIGLKRENIDRQRSFLSSLLDPSKFSIEHSYSMSFSSFGGQSLQQGMYMSTLNYTSDPVLVQLRIGYLHSLGGSLQPYGTEGTLFLQRAMVQYKPTSNLTLTFDYQTRPASMYAPFRLRY